MSSSLSQNLTDTFYDWPIDRSVHHKRHEWLSDTWNEQRKLSSFWYSKLKWTFLTELGLAMIYCHFHSWIPQVCGLTMVRKQWEKKAKENLGVMIIWMSAEENCKRWWSSSTFASLAAWLRYAMLQVSHQLSETLEIEGLEVMERSFFFLYLCT